MVTNLPKTFPTTVDVQLLEGTHHGTVQLWAPYEHNGARFKLVLSLRETQRRQCKAGEQWKLRPNESPNGHIVFCFAETLTRTAAGIIPLVADTRALVGKCCAISIERIGPSAKPTGERRLGEFSDLAVEDGIVKIVVLEPIRYSSEDGLPERIEAFVLELPLESVRFYFPETAGREGSFFYTNAEGEEYKVTFHLNMWDSAWHFEEPYDDDDFDDGAHYERLALREEHYYEDREDEY